jgi:uncharacterized protein (DUF2252 family)
MCPPHPPRGVMALATRVGYNPAVATHVAHASVEERVASGKAARSTAPRSSHAAFEPAADRPDPIALLEEQSATRVPELVPIRYGRMLDSPFAFLRGSALIMASDLARTPVSGIRAQLCGDAHLANFGLFASPDRQLVFDLNDFDETLAGPWEWDLKRLATSMVVAGRENGISRKERADIVLDAVGLYRTSMRAFADMKNLEVFYARLDADGALDRLSDQVSRQVRKNYRKTVAKARTSDSVKALSKLTTEVDGEPRIVSDPPLIETLEDLLPGQDGERYRASLHDLLRQYRSTLERDRREALEGFRIVDVARRVGGVGSVGTRAWILLMLGRDSKDPLFLQFKEAQPSVLERFLHKSRYRNHGQRIVSGQRLMQASSDIFLGWQTVVFPDLVKRDFYARQLKDWKGSFTVDGASASGMRIYARACSWTLARAHARSGDRVAIAAYLGGGDACDRAIYAFSEAYADQNERDHAALVDAVKRGRIAAETGV